MAEVRAVGITLEGEKAMRWRLLKLATSVQGAVMRPAVLEAAAILESMARGLAPVRTGALRRGIYASVDKTGTGYCKAVVTLTPEVYYGRFQEFGLGNLAIGGRSKRVQARQANYDRSAGIWAELQARARSQGRTVADLIAAMEGKNGKLSREGKRQRIISLYGLGGLQGKRRPNMAPHRFLGPAVRFLRESLRNRMVERLWDNLKKWTVPQEQVG